MKSYDYAIKVENVSKTFYVPREKKETMRSYFLNPFRKVEKRKFDALKDISFEVKKGEFLGIIGRNGSGKSTLLKLIAGIYLPDKGEITVNGKIVPFLELGVGFNPELSGRENIFLNGTILGMGRKYLEKKFDEIVDFAEIRDFIDMPIKNYSSGMQVRLAFAITTVIDSDIYLMDEVLAVGDSNFQSKCLEEFNKYRDLGKTVVLVTHDIGTVQRYCDRAMLLRNGKVEMTGDSEKVVNEYIYQNMSDEEKRKKTWEENKKNVIGKKKKTAEILRVEFLDKDGKRRNVFETGEDIIARIYYRANRAILNPVFGVAIFTQDGIHITGPNTRTSNLLIEKVEGDGYLDFSILQNPFFSGSYRLTVILHDWKCITPFDFKEKGYFFQIISKEENQRGIIKLKHLWKK